MSSTKGRTRDKPNGRKTGTGGLRAPSRAVGKRDAAKRPGKTATKGSANAAKREASRQGSPFEGGRLVMPALRSEMGSWIYYTASMQLRDVAARVRLASDIYKSRSLSELIQRAVTNRSTEIATYLRKQKSDRFFNALVLGVHGGNTLWHDIDVGANPYLSDEELEQIDGQLGALILSGAEQIFAVDGQHRVVGIQEAVGDDEDLATEHLTVIFVPYDIWDPPGMRRTRRLFTTLNRYAKPVSKRDAIALDEDDTVAITTRRLIETYPLFQNEKVSVSHTKALPVSDRKAFTTVVALYDALDAYLQGGMSRREWREFKRFRPEDETVIERYYAQAVA